MDAYISPIWQMKAIATPTVQLIENNLGENDTTENIQNRIVFAKWIQHMPIEEQEFLQNQNQPSLTRGINFLEDEEWLDMNTEKMPQRSIEMKQSQVNIQKAEPPMGMEQGIQINHMDREEPQVMEQATTKIDIDLLLDRLEKRLWANRQRGYNRTVLR